MKNSFLLLIVSIVALSCTQQSSSVVWEPKPRFVAGGNDGQLEIRASESMSLLYAAHDKDGKQNLFLAKSNNVGDNFSEPVRVNSEDGEVSAHGENGPKLRSGKGMLLFSAWVEKKDIKFARSLNFGGSFSPAVKVNDDTGDASQSFLSMETAPDGMPYIIWLDGRDNDTDTPGTSSLYFARSPDGGVSFEKNVKISGDICPCCRPSMTFGDGGEIFVSWRHVYEGDDRRVVVSASLDGGSTWSKPKPASTKGWILNGCAHSGPVIQFVDGKLIVVWFTGEDGKVNLKMARSLDKGKTFESTREIQGTVVDANHPNMEIVGNEAWVIFQGRDPKVEEGWGPEKAWLVKISSDGTPTRPEPLPSAGGGVAYPSLFMGNGGRVYATWTEHDEDGYHVVLCRGRIRS